MSKKLYITNLAKSVDVSTLEDMFMSVGDVESIKIVTDMATGHSRGIGYVEMSTEQEAADCIDRFHGQKLVGQTMAVVVDKPREILQQPSIFLKKTRKKTMQLGSR